jgi:hypothetical protein
MYLRSGELLPVVLDNGAREGIREGLIFPFEAVDLCIVDCDSGFPRIVLKLVGVFERSPVCEAPFTVPALLGAAEDLEFDRP